VFIFASSGFVWGVQDRVSIFWSGRVGGRGRGDRKGGLLRKKTFEVSVGSVSQYLTDSISQSVSLQARQKSFPVPRFCQQSFLLLPRFAAAIKGFRLSDGRRGRASWFYEAAGIARWEGAAEAGRSCLILKSYTKRSLASRLLR